MKFDKTPHLLVLLICFCVVLLSGCGTANNTGPSVIANGHTPTVTGTARSAKSTATALPTDCPAAGTIRAVNLPAATSAAQPAVFYLTEGGGVQSGISPLNLMRYDLTTGKTTSIFSFAGTPVGAGAQVQLSPDKRWLLIMHYSSLNDTTSIARMQLMRTDGTQLQTLICSSSDFPLSATWLPDGKQVALIRGQYDQRQKVWLYTVDVLNLATGKTRTMFSGDYFPYDWLDDHRLIVEKEIEVNNLPSKADFYLFDTNNGSQQKLTNLPHIASFAFWGSLVYGSVAVGSDSSQLFTSSFTDANTNQDNCQGALIKGPGTLNSYVIASGSTHTIYSDQSHAIQSVLPVNTHTLLIYIENNTGDLSQNGLWKINTDGTGLTRLTTANDPKCRDTNYPEWAPQIAHNDQSYALLQTDFNQGEAQSIVLGKLSGGTPTTIATSANVSLPRDKPAWGPLLQVVGMA